ncbi:MAG: hypothetical protein KGI75_01260 [Rhizobiaceae bacterium]|nr:hypothetical protein [Rhizobiaceae bacterium]
MNAEGHEADVCDVSEVDARAELERLLSDPRFHATDRSRAFLKYVAECVFAGQEEGVKAYSIAIDVLGRASNFDPSIDPIVRIEASRLRSSLSQYYEAFGDQLDVVINLPKGRGYVPIFTRCVGAAEQVEEEPEDCPLERNEPVIGLVRRATAPSRSTPNRGVWAAGAVAAIVAVAAVSSGLIWGGRGSIVTDKPSVTLSMSAADTTFGSEASVTEDYLVSALSQFRTLTISAQKEMAPSATMPGPVGAGSYDVDLKYYGDTDERSVWWQVVDAQSGEMMKSGVERVRTDGKSAGAVRDELVEVLSRRLATTRGVINNIEIHDSANVKALGNACVLRAEYALEESGSNSIADASDCLERTYAAQPENSDVAATLSRIILVSQTDQPSAVTLERSLTLANKAVSLAPMSDRANIALMLAQFYSGRTEAAISAGNRALALNPNNPDVSANLAAVLFASGFFDAGVALAHDAAESVDAVPRDANLVLALDAYRRGDYSEASLLAEQINCSDFVVRAVRAAALGELGSPDAVARLEELRKRSPDFETGFIGSMNARHFQPELTSLIEKGLIKAGAQFQVASKAE